MGENFVIFAVLNTTTKASPQKFYLIKMIMILPYFLVGDSKSLTANIF